MKTSNKILLATFLTVILILVSVHIAIYAKYKKGDYIVMTDDMWPTNMITQSLTDVKYLSIENVGNLTIYTADSNKLKYDKPAGEQQGTLEITKKADTLFLLGKNQNANGKWYRTTSLSLSGSFPVKIINSEFRVEGHQTFHPIAMDITLDESSMEINSHQKRTLNFTSVKINATNKSRINFSDVHTSFLDVTLNNSFFEETGLSADSIRVSTDLDSKMELSGKNLIKAKITSYE